MDRKLMRLSKFQHQIIQREVWLGLHPRLQPVPQTAQLAMAPRIALRTRIKTTRLTFQNNHVIHEFDGNPKPSRRRPMRLPLVDKPRYSFTKLYRKLLTYPGPPYLHCRPEITDHPLWESLIG